MNANRSWTRTIQTIEKKEREALITDQRLCAGSIWRLIAFLSKRSRDYAYTINDQRHFDFERFHQKGRRYAERSWWAWICILLKTLKIQLNCEFGFNCKIFFLEFINIIIGLLNLKVCMTIELHLRTFVKSIFLIPVVF